MEIKIKFGLWVLILLLIIVIVTSIPSRPNLTDIERFNTLNTLNSLNTLNTDERSTCIQVSANKNNVYEHFGFADDESADWDLVKCGLNDDDPIIGSGNGIRDMFDFSNRFIEAHIAASNDIYVINRAPIECK